MGGGPPLIHVIIDDIRDVTRPAFNISSSQEEITQHVCLVVSQRVGKLVFLYSFIVLSTEDPPPVMGTNNSILLTFSNSSFLFQNKFDRCQPMSSLNVYVELNDISLALCVNCTLLSNIK